MMDTHLHCIQSLLTPHLAVSFENVEAAQLLELVQINGAEMHRLAYQNCKEDKQMYKGARLQGQQHVTAHVLFVVAF